MDSPLAVYVDLNHWIELAKARKAGDLALEKRLTKLVDEGRIVVPVSSVHIMEINAILRARQRNDLSAILRNVSRGWVLRSLPDVRALEIAVRLAAHFGGTQVESIKARVLTRGYLRAFGEPVFDFSSWRSTDPERAAVAERELMAEIESDAMLEQILGRYLPKIPKEGAEQNAMKAAIDDLRAQTRGKRIEDVEPKIASMLARDFVSLVLRGAREMGISSEQLEANPPRHFWTAEYLATVPTTNVWTKLHLYVARAMSRDMTVNDLYDIAHLAVAVPYCDVVVADSAMSHLLTFRKLNDVYRTRVYSDLRACIDDLERSAPPT